VLALYNSLAEFIELALAFQYVIKLNSAWNVEIIPKSIYGKLGCVVLHE